VVKRVFRYQFSLGHVAAVIFVAIGLPLFASSFVARWQGAPRPEVLLAAVFGGVILISGIAMWESMHLGMMVLMVALEVALFWNWAGERWLDGLTRHASGLAKMAAVVVATVVSFVGSYLEERRKRPREAAPDREAPG
jgi:hypothetical protein